MKSQDVKKAFEERAKDYHSKSLHWPWSLLRKREEQAVMDAWGNLEGQSVLDLGCGAGYYTRLALAHKARHVTAVDFSSQMVATLPKENVAGVVCDALTYQSTSPFDFLICAGLIEFVDDPDALLQTLRANARSDSRAVLLSPLDNVFGRLYRRFHKSNGYEITLFSVSTLSRMCEMSGWHIDRIRCIPPFTIVMGLSCR